MEKVGEGLSSASSSGFATVNDNFMDIVYPTVSYLVSVFVT